MGPAVNLVTALLLTPWNQTGWGSAAFGFSLVLGLVNLLPVEPLDGGTVVCLLADQLPEKAGRRLCSFLSWATLAILWLGGLYGVERLGTPYILLFAVLLTLDGKN